MSDEVSSALKEVRDRLTGIEKQLQILARIEEKTVAHHEQILKLFEEKDAIKQQLHALELQVAQMQPQAQSTRDNVKLILTALISGCVAGLGAYMAALMKAGGGG